MIASYFIAFVCVVGISSGQILFKLSARSLQSTGSFFALETLLLLGSSFALYGITTIGWIWVLRNIDLAKAYPIMALAFVMVPIASHFILGEKITAVYMVGVALIVLGVAVSTQS